MKIDSVGKYRLSFKKLSTIRRAFVSSVVRRMAIVPLLSLALTTCDGSGEPGIFPNYCEQVVKHVQVFALRPLDPETSSEKNDLLALQVYAEWLKAFQRQPHHTNPAVSFKIVNTISCEMLVPTGRGEYATMVLFTSRARTDGIGQVAGMLAWSDHGRAEVCAKYEPITKLNVFENFANTTYLDQKFTLNNEIDSGRFNLNTEIVHSMAAEISAWFSSDCKNDRQSTISLINPVQSSFTPYE